MKMKNLIIKMSLALALTGIVGGTAIATNQNVNTVHAAEGKELVSGFTQFIDDNDIPQLSKNEVEHWNFMGYGNQTKANGNQYMKLNKKATHIGKYRVSQEVKKYYKVSNTKFKHPIKLVGWYNKDNTHHNEVNVSDACYTNSGNILSPDYQRVDATTETPYGLGYKKINNMYYELVAWYNPARKMYVSPQFSTIEPMTNKYRAIKVTNYFGSADDIDTQPIPTYTIGKGDKATINNNFAHSNWRTKHNFKVMGGKIYATHGGGDVSAINFNKYFKKIK